MATYISLVTFTDLGIREVQDTTKRSDAVREAAKRHGVTMKEIYWTFGSFDMVVIFEAPDDAAITALALTVGKTGYVRTQTSRAFSKDEMNGIIANLA